LNIIILNQHDVQVFRSSNRPIQLEYREVRDSGFLNCITHLSSLIPDKELEAETIKQGKRQHPNG